MVFVEFSNVVSSVENAVVYSQNPTQQQSAMRKLQEFENYDNFLESLLIILRDKEFLNDGRLLCAICLKNLVNRCWTNRSKDTRLITPNEKLLLRNFLTQHWDEVNLKISVQLAVLTAKIARHDWPTEWPDLLDVLFQQVSSGESQARFRSMNVLFHVLEELSSKRMRSTQESFNLITTQMFPVMVPVWREISNLIINMLPAISKKSYPAERDLHTEALFTHLYTTIRVIHRILLTGYPIICHIPDIIPFFEEFSSHLTRLIDFLRGNYRPQYSDDESDDEDDGDNEGGGDWVPVWRPNADGVVVLNFLLRRAIRRMIQLPVDLQKAHPLPIAPLLAPFLSLYSYLLNEQFTDTRQSTVLGTGPTVRLQNTILIGSVLFLSNVLSCRAYVDPPLATPRRLSSDCDDSPHRARSPLPRDRETPNEDEKRFHIAHNTIEKFFQPQLVTELMQWLLHRLLILSDPELFLWRSEPEEFVLRAQAELEADSVRAASEGLFLGLLDKAPDVVIPVILHSLSDPAAQMSAVSSATSAAEILGWDALYLCAGLGVSELSRVWEGDGGVDERDGPVSPRWLTEATGPALLALCTPGTSSGAGLVSGCPVLKRRMFWMLHCWAFTLDAASLALVGGLMVGEICAEPVASYGQVDVVVKLQAADTLAALLVVPTFKPQMLADHVSSAVYGLCMLSLRLEQSTYRARTVEVVGELVLALGPYVRPHLPSLVDHLCGLWLGSDTSGDDVDSPLRPAILETLARIVRIGRTDSSSLHVQLLPLTVQVLGRGDEEVCGYSDALTLWLAIIRNSRLYTAELENMYTHCVSAWLEHGEAAQSQSISRDLALISQAYAVQGKDQFLNGCGALLVRLTTRLLDQLSARSVSWALRPVEAILMCTAVPHATSLLCQSQMMSGVLRVCAASVPGFSAYSADEIADVGLVEYLHLCSLIILYGGEALSSLRAVANDVAQAVGRPGTDLVLGVVRLLLDKFDCVGSGGVGTGHRKLWALSLLSLYPTQDAAVTSWLPEVLAVVDSVVTQLESDDSDELSVTAMALEMLSFEAGVLDEAGGDVSDIDDGGRGEEAAGERVVEILVGVLQGGALCAGAGVLRGHTRAVVQGMSDMLGGERLRGLLSALDGDLLTRVCG